MNYRDHRITCDRSTCHGINESGGRSGYQLVSKLSDRRNEIFGIKSRMDPWNFRIVKKKKKGASAVASCS